MTEKEEKLLADLEVRMRQLMFFCDSLKAENNQLKQELSQKDNSISELESGLDQLKDKYNNLRVAKSISSSNKEEVLLAKKRLSKLVRDVDKCISILKN